MPRCFIDHIAIAAPTLESGAAHVRETLGVSPQPGGTHPRMGTHNLLLRLGETSYLEVIAPDPAAPAPNRPRWFALDTLTADAAPALSFWVARTDDIHAAVAAASEPLGEVEPMRRGALDWLITIPADGSLPLDGIGPALIEWHADRHPASGMPDQGVTLVELELLHPDAARVERLLQSLGLEAPVSVSSAPAGSGPRLVAHIDTPNGRRRLTGRA
jgi:hypothetical protein